MSIVRMSPKPPFTEYDRPSQTYPQVCTDIGNTTVPLDLISLPFLIIADHTRFSVRYTWWYSPISANDWGNPNSSSVKSTGCYTLISSFRSKQRGDVIAFPASSGSGHVGIVYNGFTYISAGNNKVNKKGYPSGKETTIWRYKYNSSKC
ncbi:uncharacterized protein LOC134686199 isoform X3 [Mytilus trossulus]|uniref:uncharacterized protein LOC134686199 isoform X3 n=1 Tax=Mytilus trossulus TaxID=6551 RepID=UPI0030075452